MAVVVVMADIVLLVCMNSQRGGGYRSMYLLGGRSIAEHGSQPRFIREDTVFVTIDLTMHLRVHSKKICMDMHGGPALLGAS